MQPPTFISYGEKLPLNPSLILRFRPFEEMINGKNLFGIIFEMVGDVTPHWRFTTLEERNRVLILINNEFTAKLG